jgi:nicotinamide-nucleotide amidase
MNSKLISIGDEILIGQIINSNASYISEKLYRIGIPVKRVVTIGDNEFDLINELEDSMKNYDLTIITGGLGPTHDDITKPILVKYFNDKLIKNSEILKKIKNIFRVRNIKFPEVNLQQAYVPQKSKIIWNKYGTAPGILYNKFNKVFIALPGVPFEMKEMLDNEVIPLLLKRFGSSMKTKFKSSTILTTGLSESELFEKLGDIKKITKFTKLAFLPSLNGIRLRSDAEGKNLTEVNAKLSNAEKLIKHKIKRYIYGKNDDLMEENIGKILIKKKKSLSVAESCTGGLLASKITDISGSSKYFCGGVCTYTNKSKVEILNVRNSAIKKFGAVSEEVAIEMAKNVREKFHSDIGISITGIAGPAGGTKFKPVGTVYIGYSDNKNAFAKKFLFGTYRERNRHRAVMSALIILFKQLSND